MQHSQWAFVNGEWSNGRMSEWITMRHIVQTRVTVLMAIAICSACQLTNKRQPISDMLVHRLVNRTG